MRPCISELVLVSRPGLWLVFIWLYLWPTGGYGDLLVSSKFWLGLLYCTFPLNLLVYGMNDMVDTDTDSGNERKGNFIYGSKLRQDTLRQLPKYIFLINLVPLAFLVLLDSSLTWSLCCWFLAAFAVNYVYNNKPLQLSRRCPYELPTMILGHLLIPYFACRINDLPLPSAQSVLFHIFLLSRSHIWLEYADVDVDRKVGKRTIAVSLGKTRTLVLVLSLTAIESLCGFLLLESNILGLFSLLGIVVFAIEGLKEQKFKSKSKRVILVSVSQSLVGAALMVYLWRHRVLNACAMQAVSAFFQPHGRDLLFNGASNPSQKECRISLTIRLWNSEGSQILKDSVVSIKTTSNMRNIFRLFSIRESPDSSLLGYFRFSIGSRLIDNEDTPQDLGLNDGDCIDAQPEKVFDRIGTRFV